MTRTCVSSHRRAGGQSDLPEGLRELGAAARQQPNERRELGNELLLLASFKLPFGHHRLNLFLAEHAPLFEVAHALKGQLMTPVDVPNFAN